MKFELNAELLGRIVFGMENQETVMLFDSLELDLVPADQLDEAARLEAEAADSPAEIRYLPLPSWQSVDGFQMMESFVGSLHNPIAREELRSILKNGRGVFRLFKNALRQRPEIERQWFQFREKAMSQRVMAWYNEWRELWGLAPLASLESELVEDDLVASDFELRRARPEELAGLAAWDRELLAERHPEASPALLEHLWWWERQSRGLDMAQPGSWVFAAVAPDGECAGFVWGLESVVAGPGGTRRFNRLLQLAVRPVYRDIGLGSALLLHWEQAALQAGAESLMIEMPAGAAFMEAQLQARAWRGEGKLWRLDAPAPD